MGSFQKNWPVTNSQAFYVNYYIIYLKMTFRLSVQESTHKCSTFFYS